MNRSATTRRGVLALAATLAGCANIPTLPDGPADPMERHARLTEAQDGAPLLAGNRLDLLDGGGAAFSAMFRAIAAARDHINLEFYILEDVQVPGTAGPTLFEMLAAKLSMGVAVTIIHDGFGSGATPAEAWAGLERAGARIVTFNPLSPFEARRGWLPNDRDHRKILVVDGRIAFMGGVNLAKVYENACEAAGAVAQDPEDACWRDAAIRLEGPSVGVLQRLFFETWERQGGAPLPPRDWFPPPEARGPARIRILGSVPGDRRPHYYLAALAAIAAARQRLWLCTGFFVPTHQERVALRAAARRGVQVRLLLPSVSDSGNALAAQHAAYGDLLEAGAEIREVQGAVLHAKICTVDGAWSAIGSSNLDRRSVAWNNEVDAIVLGGETAAALEALLARDWARARPIDLASWRDRGPVEWLREQRARLVIDLL